MLTLFDIGWAAGFYEGEGSFNKHYVSITQKQKWPLEKCQELFGGEISEYNEYFYWRIYGKECRGFVLTIFTFLSPRRRRQILEYSLFFKDPNFLPSNFCPNGHEYTPENTFIEKGRGREWRTCKICRKDKYDKRNEKRRNEAPEDKMIKMIAKANNISIEKAKELFDSTKAGVN